jgi:hypothetical protein
MIAFSGTFEAPRSFAFSRDQLHQEATMKTLLSSLMAVALAASFAVPLPMEAQAAPGYMPIAPARSAPAAEQARPEVQQAAHTYRHWKRQQRRAERRHWRRQAWRERHYRDRHYYRDGYYGFAPRYYRHRYYRRPGVTLEFNF